MFTTRQQEKYLDMIIKRWLETREDYYIKPEYHRTEIAKANNRTVGEMFNSALVCAITIGVIE